VLVRPRGLRMCIYADILNQRRRDVLSVERRPNTEVSSPPATPETKHTHKETTSRENERARAKRNKMTTVLVSQSVSNEYYNGVTHHRRRSIRVVVAREERKRERVLKTARLRFFLLDNVRVTRIGDGHARHAVVATASRTEVDVVCEFQSKRVRRQVSHSFARHHS
jgi:hypothetical protein